METSINNKKSNEDKWIWETEFSEKLLKKILYISTYSNSSHNELSCKLAAYFIFTITNKKIQKIM